MVEVDVARKRIALTMKLDTASVPRDERAVDGRGRGGAADRSHRGGSGWQSREPSRPQGRDGANVAGLAGLKK